MATVLMLGLWSMMTMARETPVGRTLRTWMVERPAARLSRIMRGHVVMIILASAVIGAAWWLGGDMVRFLGMAAPDAAAWVITFDVATYADLLATVVLASSTTRMRGLMARAVAPIRRCASGHRRTRKGPRPARPAPANDDEDGRSRIAA